MPLSTSFSFTYQCLNIHRPWRPIGKLCHARCLEALVMLLDSACFASFASGSVSLARSHYIHVITYAELHARTSVISIKSAVQCIKHFKNVDPKDRRFCWRTRTNVTLCTYLRCSSRSVHDRYSCCLRLHQPEDTLCILSTNEMLHYRRFCDAWRWRGGLEGNVHGFGNRKIVEYAHFGGTCVH